MVLNLIRGLPVKRADEVLQFSDREVSNDIRTALESMLGLPVVYNNDGNAAALYAHFVRFGPEAAQHSSISAIVSWITVAPR